MSLNREVVLALILDRVGVRKGTTTVVVMTDLDLIPTEDLLNALKRRFDHMVFAGIKNMGGGGARTSSFWQVDF